MPELTKRTRKEVELTMADYRTLVEQGFKFVGAGLYQVMGPHWRHIYWVDSPIRGRRPYVNLTATPDQVRAALRLAAAR